MSNIAGKTYAMNVVTPIPRYQRWVNRAIFLAVQLKRFAWVLKGLKTLSLIHYARWAIVAPHQWPRLEEEQPKETLKYSYMLFFSNFNGSWEQYIDSFHKTIPNGLNIVWWRNVGFPGSVPLAPFHRYINQNQLWTSHYYSAYPLASSNDVKSADTLYDALVEFSDITDQREGSETAENFLERFDALLLDVQHHISPMQPTPIVSLAHQAVENRARLEVQREQSAPTIKQLAKTRTKKTTQALVKRLAKPKARRKEQGDDTHG